MDVGNNKDIDFNAVLSWILSFIATDREPWNQYIVIIFKQSRNVRLRLSRLYWSSWKASKAKHQINNRHINSAGLEPSILTPYSWWHLDMILILWWNYYSLGAGATDLLVEWEDMFPYWGPIANISAKWATAARQYIWYLYLVPGIPTQSQRSPHCYRCPSSQIEFFPILFPLPGPVSHFCVTGGERERPRSDSSHSGASPSCSEVLICSSLRWHFDNIFFTILFFPVTIFSYASSSSEFRYELSLQACS